MIGEIEKDVPLAEHKNYRVGRKPKYNLHKLEIGQSIEVPLHIAVSASIWYWRRKTGYNFTWDMNERCKIIKRIS